MDKATEIGRRVADLRKQSKVTQVDLATIVGVKRSTIASIEVGSDQGGISTMIAIADYFKVPMDWLLCRRPPAGGPLVGRFVDDPDELAWLGFWMDMDDAERHGVLKFLSGKARRAAV